LKIPVENGILIALKETAESFTKTIKEITALQLYKSRNLSLGKAAQLAGYDKIQYINKLRSEGIPVFDYTDSEHRIL